MLPLAATAPPEALVAATPSPAFVATVIAGTVSIFVAVMSHVLTRSREHREWVREQQFEVVRQLRTAYRTFQPGFSEGIGVKVPSPGIVELRLPEPDRDWTDVEEAHTNYFSATKDLDMLTLDPGIREKTQQAREALVAAHTYLREARTSLHEHGKLPEPEHGCMPGTESHFAGLIIQEFADTHSALQDAVQARYFTRPWDRLAAWTQERRMNLMRFFRRKWAEAHPGPPERLEDLTEWAQSRKGKRWWRRHKRRVRNRNRRFWNTKRR